MAITVTVCVVDQLASVKTSCGTTFAEPAVARPVRLAGFAWSVRPTSTRAVMSLVWVVSALPIEMTRPRTLTSYSRTSSWRPSAAAISESVSPNCVV